MVSCEHQINFILPAFSKISSGTQCTWLRPEALQDLTVIVTVTQGDVMILHMAETEEGSRVGRGLGGKGTLFP